MRLDSRRGKLIFQVVVKISSVPSQILEISEPSYLDGIMWVWSGAFSFSLERFDPLAVVLTG
jgi:hypothetical protein